MVFDTRIHGFIFTGYYANLTRKFSDFGALLPTIGVVEVRPLLLLRQQDVWHEAHNVQRKLMELLQLFFGILGSTHLWRRNK